MPRTTDDDVRSLRASLSLKHNNNVATLVGELRYLRQRIEIAEEAMANGQPLDEHMIHNAGQLTARIARYNLHLEIAPYLEEG